MTFGLLSRIKEARADWKMHTSLFYTHSSVHTMANATLTTLEGLAIILVLLEHSYPPVPYSGLLGVLIFGFTSGYKLILNHREDILHKSFLKGYAIQRFIRLIKPYIGYTLLILPAEAALVLLSNTNKFQFLNEFAQVQMLKSTPMQELIIQFLLGKNPFVIPLWFLYTLMIVTLLCFLMIYLFDIRLLFLALVILFPAAIIYSSISIIPICSAFIIGMFSAYYLPLISIRYNPLAYCGQNAFHIYLLHAPFILSLIYILLKPLPELIRTSLVVILTIIVSIGVYFLLLRLKINKVFE